MLPFSRLLCRYTCKLGVIAQCGPAAAAKGREGRARIAYLDYDWSLNDIASTR